MFAGDAEVKEVPADALLLVGLAFGWLPPLEALARARLCRRDLARRSDYGRALHSSFSASHISQRKTQPAQTLVTNTYTIGRGIIVYGKML